MGIYYQRKRKKKAIPLKLENGLFIINIVNWKQDEGWASGRNSVLTLKSLCTYAELAGFKLL